MMMFNVATPWAFVLIPLPWIIYYVVPKARQASGYALRVPFFQRMVVAMPAYAKISMHCYAYYMLWLMWLLLILAAAGPQWVGEPIPMMQQGRNIMLALDISGSMQIPDMQLKGQQVNRLRMVKVVASQFIQQRQGDRMGLILFGSKAYLQTPLTFDLKTVQAMLQDASIGLAGPQTALGDAVGLAIKRLRARKAQHNILIVLTDGANNAGVVKPVPAARLAARYGIKIYTIGLGAERLIVPSLLGPQAINPSVDLDQAALKSMAHVTGGLFFRAMQTHDLERVYQAIDRLEPVAGGHSVFRPIVPYYHWPLACAGILSVLLVLQRLGYTRYRVR